MIARPRLRPAVRVRAALPLAAAALAGPLVAGAQADVILPPPADSQPVDATVRAACSQPGVENIRATTIDVRVQGQLPLAAYNGSDFTFDQLTARFTIEPDLMRPQVEGTRGSLNMRIDDLGLVADGGVPERASVVSPKAPLDLGTKPVKIASAPVFDAPVGAPKAVFDPVGPWTVSPTAGGVAVGLDAFTLTLTAYPEPSPTAKIAPTVTSLICKPGNRFFSKFPVNGPGPVEKVPVITSLEPNIGPGGATVTIRGEHLLNATGVEFEGNPAVFKLVSDTEVRAIVPTLYFLVPPPPTLAWDVSVTNATGTSADTAADDFTYLTGTPFPPVVKAITPASVPWFRGGTVKVTGEGFKGATKVTIGGTYSKFSVGSDNELKVAAAPRLPGRYALRVTTPGGTSPASKTAVITYR